MEKSQRKIFQFLILSLALRNNFDVIKISMMVVLGIFWNLFWLTSKRAEHLVSRNSREFLPHLKIMFISGLIIILSFIVSFNFLNQYLA